MKIAETKTTTASLQKGGEPFFLKGVEQGFFSGHAVDTSFFAKGKNTQPSIQAKLTIGQPDDKYEKEADAMADKVVQRLAMPDVLERKEPGEQARPLAAAITPLVQTKCAACEQDEKLQKREEEDLVQESSEELQRKPIFESSVQLPDDDNSNNIQRKCAECEKEGKLQTKSVSSDPAPITSYTESNLNSTKGRGSPMPASTREQMESSFGSDFSHVRLHCDSSAVQMSKDLHAQAFTHGSDIYFNSGKYNADSVGGKHLLAHELTHVLQQKGDNNIFTKTNTSFLSPGSINQSSANLVQRAPDDKHDLTATQLSGDPILEQTFDNEAIVGKFSNSNGDHVKKIQEGLIQLGIPLSQFGPDGIFGNETEKGVKDFQQKASMSKSEWDGIVGRKTIGLLDRSLRNNKISTDTDKAEDDLKLNDPKKRANDEACKGKPTDEACPVPNTAVNASADDAIARIDKVISEQLPPEKKEKTDYPDIFSRLFRNNDKRAVKDTADEVKANFNSIKAYLQRLKTDPTLVRCGTDCDGGCRSGTPAYYSPNNFFIRFCPGFASHPQRTSIVLHESHHASIDKSDDFAYADTRLIDKLDHKDALLNAASFHLYAALVADPASDTIGPKVKDTNTINDATQRKNINQAIAFMEQWFRTITLDMSQVAQAMQEAREKGKYSDNGRPSYLINSIYTKWFEVTPAPTRPSEIDVKKANAIEERGFTMEEAFASPFTITESATVSEWQRGPGKSIQVNQQLLSLDMNHMVIALLQELVHATPDISAESEPLYVGTVNDLRKDRGLAP